MNTENMGRPSKYNEEMNNKVDEYIAKCIKEKDIPVVAELALELNVSKRVLYDWAKVHKSFLHSLAKVNALQESILVKKGLKSEYNSTITKLMLSSNHGYSERVKNEEVQPKASLDGSATDFINNLLNENDKTDTNSPK